MPIARVADRQTTRPLPMSPHAPGEGASSSAFRARAFSRARAMFWVIAKPMVPPVPSTAIVSVFSCPGYPWLAPLHGKPAGQVRCEVASLGYSEAVRNRYKERLMGIVLLVLLLALILGGLGFAVHVLWWIALVVLAVWLLGFLVRSAEGGGRWYRWLPMR
jgi:hypothetical protein